MNYNLLPIEDQAMNYNLLPIEDQAMNENQLPIEDQVSDDAAGSAGGGSKLSTDG